MDIRYLLTSDEAKIKYIYDTYFSDMDYPDFYGKFHAVFVVEDFGKILAVGGLKPICEAIVVTNKSSSVRKRMEALLRIFNSVKYSAEKLKYEQIHAFSFDEEYTKHLTNRMGFKCIQENRVLTLDIKNG